MKTGSSPTGNTNSITSVCASRLPSPKSSPTAFLGWQFQAARRYLGSSVTPPHKGAAMPEETAKQRAEEDRREGKSPSTQAGEFVREEIPHVREGKHGARSPQQAIAIGLSKARRAGVKLPPPKARGRTTRQAKRDLAKAVRGRGVHRVEGRVQPRARCEESGTVRRHVRRWLARRTGLHARAAGVRGIARP